MSKVVLILPGCTDFDEQQRVQGTLDLPLNSRGAREVAALVADLRPYQLEAIYTGPCRQARSTADSLAAALKVPVKELDALRNLDQGLWQGLQIDEIRRKHPRVFRQWQESPESICPPGGEMIGDAVERLESALARPIRKHAALGIVAPEPLSSLIAAMLAGSRPDFSDFCSEVNGHPRRMFQVFHSTGKGLGDSTPEIPQMADPG